jgi:hypothetical protein
MLFWPDSFLLFNSRLEEIIRGFWSRGFPLLSNYAKVVVDFAYYTSLFPGFAFSSVLSGCFICFPCAFWQDPATALDRLDKEHIVLVSR